jgi:hypothetical protein
MKMLQGLSTYKVLEIDYQIIATRRLEAQLAQVEIFFKIAPPSVISSHINSYIFTAYAQGSEEGQESDSSTP